MVVNWFIRALLVEGKTGDVGVLMGEAISALTVSFTADSIGVEIEGGATEELVA